MKRALSLALAALAAIIMATSYLPAGAPSGPSVPVPQEGTWTTALPSFAVANPGAVDLGPLPTQPLTVGLALPPINSQDLDQLIQSMYTPGSPDYGHYLSPALFQAAFSPTSAQVSEAEQYYASYGLALQPSADRMILQVSGPSSSIGAAFHTSFDRFELAGGTQVYGPASPVIVPQSLGISGVTGFSDQMNIRPADGAPQDSAIVPAPATSNAPAPGCNPVSGNSPAELEGQYNDPVGTYNGKGITVGIVDAYDSSETQTDLKSQLDSFASGCGLATPTINFLYPVRTTANLNSTPSTGWGGETILDIETVDSMAPGTTIDLALASDSSLAVYETVDFLVAYNLTQTISESWGEPDLGTDYEPPQNPCLAYYSCNASWDGSYAFLHPIYAEAVAEGITPFAAAGDCGAYDGTGILTTDYPGSDPYVTDVGGTVLNSSGDTYGGESGWSGTGYECTANIGGGGGGYAPFPRPWWQSGEGLSTTNSLRGAPDVSASSADGTSEATPIWAGLTAVADQEHGGAGLGLLGPAIYSILRTPTEYAADFHDIVVGNNYYPCGRGWDPVTGIGSPNIANLIPNLWRTEPSSVGTMSATLTASPGNTAAETFTAGATGGVPPYHYDFVPGLYQGQWAGVNSSLKYTYSGTGAFFATVEVWDSTGNWTESSPVLVQIGGTALTGTLTPSATSIAVGTSVSFTTSASGGTAPYSYDYLWGDGSYGYNGTVTEAHVYENDGTYCPSVEVLDSATPRDGAVLYSTCIAVGGGSPLRTALTATPSSGSPPLTVDFSAGPSGGTPPYTYLWSYGDGSAPSVASAPVHVYNRTGTFAVNLTVMDSVGNTAHAFTNITVSGSVLAASIAASKTSGAPPLSVAFSSTVTGGTPSFTYAWTFGDGGTSISANPTHTYTTVGVYSASLTVKDSVGHTAVSNTISISVSSFPVLTAAATATPLDGSAPLAVQFNGTAGGGEPAYAWSWDFGDGSPASALRNPSHTYTSAGTYTVVLKVTDQQPLSATSSVTVLVVAPLVGTATAEPTSGAAPLAVTFNATATGGEPGYVWAWTFGDGGRSSVENPSHTFSTVGTFEVGFWVNDSWGDSWSTTLPVQVAAATPLSVAAGGDPESTVNVATSYWAAATGGTAPYSFSWSFGDGTSSVATGAQNSSTHTYSKVGTYSLVVTVTDALGHSATSSPFTVYVTSGVALAVKVGGLPSTVVGATASMWAAASGGASGYSYTWTFGDSSTATTTSVNSTTHVYEAVGNYDVSVTVHDVAGASASASYEIQVGAAASPPSSGGSGGNLLFQGGSVTPVGWVLVAAVAVAVVVAALLLRRRQGSSPPPDEWTPPPIPGAEEAAPTAPGPWAPSPPPSGPGSP